MKHIWQSLIAKYTLQKPTFPWTQGCMKTDLSVKLAYLHLLPNMKTNVLNVKNKKRNKKRKKKGCVAPSAFLLFKHALRDNINW